MNKYKVWDASNGDTIETASEFEAHSPDEAAELYGESDVDGQSDGVYVNEGLEVFVMGPDGVTHRFHLTAEYEPTFYAVEVAEEAPAAHAPVDGSAREDH